MNMLGSLVFFFFSSRRRHTRCSRDWSSDVCSSDLSRSWGERKGKKPIARILAAASAGVEPRIMGVGPAYAIPAALQRANLKLSDMDVIEINEAFASQVLGCLKLMNVDFKDPRVNPNG